MRRLIAACAALMLLTAGSPAVAGTAPLCKCCGHEKCAPKTCEKRCEKEAKK